MKFKDIKVGDPIYLVSRETQKFEKKIVVSIHECGDRTYYTFDGIFEDNADETIYEDAIYIIDYEMECSYVDCYIADLKVFKAAIEKEKKRLLDEFTKNTNACDRLIAACKTHINVK